MVDLWPNDITVDQVTLKSPVNILREQASLLSQKTKNLVKARVKPYVHHKTASPEIWYQVAKDSLISSPSPLEQSAQKFEYSFELIAPVLDNYSYLLFVVAYDVNIYPVAISLAKDLRAEISIEPQANSEDEFLALLRRIFTAPKTRSIIQALIAQSVDLDTEVA